MSQSTSNIQFNGLVPNNLPVNTRAVVDNNYVVTVNLAAAGATANTNALDLGDFVSGVPYVTTETINVGILTSASANGNSNVIGIVLQDAKANTDGTANTSSWANISQLAQLNVTQGASSTAASSFTVKLPPGTRRFIRAQETSPGSPNVTDAVLTLELLY